MSAPRTRTATPQTVSACLRRAGYLPTPRTMAGVHVTRSYKGSSISADWDSDSRSRREMILIAEILTAAGYIVDVSSESGTTASVFRPES